MKKLRDFYENCSMRFKLLISCLCSAILFVICSAIGLHIIDHNNQKLLAHSLQANVELSTQTISDALHDIEQLTFQVMSNSKIQQSLGRVYYADPDDPSPELTANIIAQDVYDELWTIQNQGTPYISYLIVTCGQFTSRTDFTAYQELSDSLDYLVERAEEQSGSPVWVKNSSERLVAVREIREIYSSRFTNFGTVIVGVDAARLINDISSSIFGGNICLLYFGDELLQFPNTLNEADIAWLENGLSDMTAGSYRVVDFQNKAYFAVSGNVDGFPDWSYTTLIPYQEYASSIRTSSVIYYAVILLSLLLSILLNLLILKNIIRDLDNLILKMQLFHGQEEPMSNFDVNYSDRTDELGVLHQEFDSMVSEIQQLIHVSYTNELLMKDAQLKALEMQINPHFLYNTLESINWRAKATGSQEISQMVEALGNLLRKTLSHRSQKNTLQEELDIVRYYMTIMDLRFEDRLGYHIQASDTLLNAEIPTLTIQPLVENAANYALEEMTELCYIDIEAKWYPEEPFHYMILVRNTGTEFEEDLLEKLKKSLIRPKGLGIGLLNIEERLRLTFGDDFHFDFYNEGEYAVARIILPYRSTDGA